jgi:L-seryl-tRNA(Ser) seleniumtransferase
MQRNQKLPRVDEIAAMLDQKFSRPVRIEATRIALAEFRFKHELPTSCEVIVKATEVAGRFSNPSIPSAFNLTGVILHTGLGRAPVEFESDGGYQELEICPITGERGDRQDHVREHLIALTGAESAFVCNNAAGAVLLSLSALCKHKEVLLSRGQNVEIGGSFRIPDVAAASGCVLVDVGTTNQTRISDYESALGPNVAAILVCSPSNYKVEGYSGFPPLQELAKLAKRRRIPLIVDQGNGALISLDPWGISDVESVPKVVKAGADITIFSGDKLLGGPQAGILVGSKKLISRLSKHPLARALRCNKSTINQLRGTLHAYRFNTKEQKLRGPKIPLYELLNQELIAVKARTEAIAQTLSALDVSVVQSKCKLGSGCGPNTAVRSYAVKILCPSPKSLAEALRRHRIYASIGRGAVYLDPFCVAEYQLDSCLDKIRTALNEWNSQ